MHIVGLYYNVECRNILFNLCYFVLHSTLSCTLRVTNNPILAIYK